jgi:hypothetical protein
MKEKAKDRAGPGPVFRGDKGLEFSRVWLANGDQTR